MFTTHSITIRFWYLLAAVFSGHTWGYSSPGHAPASFSVPVQFSKIVTAQVSPRDIKLSWQTYLQIQCEQFSVMHSRDGFEWQVVGKIQGAGTTDSIIDYEFYHYNADSGDHYYRIMEQDFAGNTAFSEVAYARIKNESPQKGLYPVPASDQLFFMNESSEDGVIHVNGVYGKALLSPLMVKKNEKVVIDVSGFAEGVYFLQCGSTTLQFVVKR